jgi:uncharacterized protein (DUF952 family)
MSQIYHLAPAARWATWPADQPYLPDEYTKDGFIHCTEGDALMLRVANRFYRTTPGAFVLVVLETEHLTSELRWEAASDGMAALFPHIYGPINQDAVVAVRRVVRAADGEFIRLDPAVHEEKA